MKILVIEPERKPEVREIDGELETMQGIVGGLIQATYPFGDTVALIVNDEGKILGLPMNRGLRDENGRLYDIICGTFFICGLGEENFASLTDEQIQKYKKVFAVPELFVNLNGRLAILPMEQRHGQV